MFRRRRKVYVDDLDRPHDIRFFLAFVVIVAVVAGGVYGVSYLMTRDTVPQGTTVAGIDIGGGSTASAERALEREMGARLREPVAMHLGERRFKLRPFDFGIGIDVAATVDDARGGSDTDPRHMLAVLTGGDAVAPVVQVDRAKLQRAVTRLRRQVDREPASFRVAFQQGRPLLVEGHEGVRVNATRLMAALREQVEAGDDEADPVALPVRRTPPPVSWATASRFIDRVGTRAVARPVTLVIDGRSVEIDQHQLAGALSTTVVGHRLKLSGAGRVLLRRLPNIDQVAGSPVDARIVVRGGRPVVRPGRRGQAASPEEWGDALARAAGSKNRRAVVTTVPVPPAVTADKLRHLGLRRVIATGSVAIPSNVRRAGVAQAARDVSGALVTKRRQVSLVQRLGRSAGSTESDVVASVVFGTALRAGLDVPSWTAAGTAALPTADGVRVNIGAPGPDLRLATRAPYGAYVRAYVSPGRKKQPAVLHVEIWSTRYWRTSVDAGPRAFTIKPHVKVRTSRKCRPRRPLPGYRIILRRSRVHGSQRLKDQFVSAYRPRDGVVCRRGRR